LALLLIQTSLKRTMARITVIAVSMGNVDEALLVLFYEKVYQQKYVIANFLQMTGKF